MNTDIYEAIKNRRTIYNISKESPIPDERIIETVGQAVKYAPSAFNSQSGRAVVLLGAQHDRLWDIVMETLRNLVPPEAFPQTEARIRGFRNGYGTVLFFEDQQVVRSLQESFALYRDNFPVWSQNSTGMLQYVTWVLLEAEGFGASLQHYNPLIDEEVRKAWDLPESWKLTAQMPFGRPTAPAGDKEFQPLDARVRVFR
jgi:predicted oxidoreductase (fatty acid repression mutant protein)